MIEFHKTTEFWLDGPCAVTLGKFDGLHRGHQKLLGAICAHPDRSVVFAFNPRQTDLLLTPDEERQVLLDFDMDVFIDCPFVPEISGMTPEAFIDQILVERIHASYIAVGTDFRFGYQRAGDAALLKEYAGRRGIRVEILEKECWEGREISSTYVREALRVGDMPRVSALLGRDYSVGGEIVHGRHLGTTLGMPTANIVPDRRKLLPPDGVYLSLSRIGSQAEGGAALPGLTNIGYKPTVGESFRGMETYLLTPQPELYGQMIETRLIRFVRPEQKFDTLEQLKEQIQRDIAQGRAYFGG